MAVALSVRVSTTRPPHTPTIDPPRARLRASVVTPPEWHLAAAHLDRDDG
jgi:hypothetical protein